MEVEIVDVAPRDGLQNEDKLLSTEVKVELIHRLVAAGSRRLEATSFVHPRLVPAMADAEAVMSSISRRPGVSYMGLVLNERGLERALAAGCDEVVYAFGVTDTFTMKNQRMTVLQALEAWERISEGARSASVDASLVLSVAFGCPYEGEVSSETVARVVAKCVESPPARLTVADTIGVGTPADVKRLLGAVASDIPDSVQIGTHFHNTRNTGIANAYAALEAGVRSFDASLGGVGGCPFAPNSTGNICTEDLVYLLHRMGLDTGLDLEALAEAARWLATHLGPSVVGLYSKAGAFPA